MLLAGIQLNKEAILKFYNSDYSFDFYFISKKPSSNELNGIDKVTIKANKVTSKQLIQIDLNLVIFRQVDLFSYAKQPLSLFFQTVNLNDTSEYHKELFFGFRKFDLMTKKIALYTKEEKEKNLEIDVSKILL